jgi:hypothetical protein
MVKYKTKKNKYKKLKGGWGLKKTKRNTKIKKHINTLLKINHSKLFKNFLFSNKKKKQQIFNLHGIGGIIYQFNIDKDRLNYKIKNNQVLFENCDLDDSIYGLLKFYKKEHLYKLLEANKYIKGSEITRKLQDKTKPISNILFWGTQGFLGFAWTYISNIIINNTNYIISSIKDKDTIFRCIKYDTNLITIIIDFIVVDRDLIGETDKHNINLSFKIEVNSPYDIANIVRVTFSQSLNRCKTELNFKERSTLKNKKCIFLKD